MRSMIRFTTALLGLGVAAMLAACGSDTPAAQTPTVTSTITAAPTSSPATTSDPSDDTEKSTPTVDPVATPATPDCATPDVAGDIGRIAGPLRNTRGAYWVQGESGGTRCPGLSWVSLDTNGATASSPMQLLIYHNGYFQGTGIKCNAGYQTVLASTPDSIQVRYRYLQGDDISARPSGSATVTFRWNGSEVVMDGSLPYGVTLGQC
ncbi:LppP/LprE family lipoprotein [Williamsia sp.]|uniref:LppP/LprE family lipoprotein n=1 Tax=Williamsia sp. TaxID=1872085 RepID=UPI001A34CB2C|nr:LppP/LprE family lipoprotein [Williamsia sp.]MBJ7289777.1 LppP/LprE family lipoprotein [Williamsia sp.]